MKKHSKHFGLFVVCFITFDVMFRISAITVQTSQFYFWFEDKIHNDWVIESYNDVYLVTCLQKCRRNSNCQGLALGPLNNESDGYERHCLTLSVINEADCYENEGCYKEGYQVYHVTEPYTTTTEIPSTTSTTETSSTVTSTPTVESLVTTTEPATTTLAAETTTTTTSKPTTTTTKSTTTTRKPTTTTLKPTTTTWKPPTTTTERTTTKDPTMTTTESPTTTTTESPTTTTSESPTTTTTEAPTTTTTKAPTTTTTEATTTTESPITTTTESPTTTTTESPATTTTESPTTTTTESPITTTTESPITTTSESPTTTTTESPTTTTQKITTTTEQPSTTLATTTTDCNGPGCVDIVCETQPSHLVCGDPKDQQFLTGLKALSPLFSDLTLEITCKNPFYEKVFSSDKTKEYFSPFQGKFKCGNKKQIITGLEICFENDLKFVSIECSEFEPGFELDSETREASNSKSSPKVAVCPDDTALTSVQLKKNGDSIRVFMDCSKIIKK